MKTKNNDYDKGLCKPGQAIGQLSRMELEMIVRHVQNCLYVSDDPENPDRIIFNPDKEWNADTLNDIASIMEKLNLNPDRKPQYA